MKLEPILFWSARPFGDHSPPSNYRGLHWFYKAIGDPPKTWVPIVERAKRFPRMLPERELAEFHAVDPGHVARLAFWDGRGRFLWFPRYRPTEKDVCTLRSHYPEAKLARPPWPQIQANLIRKRNKLSEFENLSPPAILQLLKLPRISKPRKRRRRYAPPPVRALQRDSSRVPPTEPDRWKWTGLPQRLERLATALDGKGKVATFDLKKSVKQEPSRIVSDHRASERWGKWLRIWIGRERGIWWLYAPSKVSSKSRR